MKPLDRFLCACTLLVLAATLGACASPETHATATSIVPPRRAATSETSRSASGSPAEIFSATTELPSVWPPAFTPKSHGRWAGVSASARLVGYTTSYPTVSKPPKWAAAFTGVIDGVQTSDRVVALTFDDGPTANTHAIVDDLNAFGDRATFFWVGSSIDTDDAQYSLASHEELANHTWNHPNMWKLTSAEASAEIGLTSARIASFTGKPPVWFRSPFNRLYSKELAQIQAHGLLYANYNVTSVDWVKGTGAAEIVWKISENLRPGGVILMHDSPHHDPAAFLPDVLTMLKLRGYRVVTLSELAKSGAPPVTEPLTLGVKGLGY